MDDLRLDNLIEETLKDIGPVQVPEDLHFDAAKIMMLARMEEEAEAEEKREETPAPVIRLSEVREAKKSRGWMRYAAAAAAFAILLGVYGMTRPGEDTPLIPGTDPSLVGEISDDEVPLAGPDLPDFSGGESEQEPATGPQTDPGVEDPGQAQTPAPPVQTGGQTPKPPVPVGPPAPQEPGVTEENEGDVTDPEQYAGGNELPDAQGEEPAPGDVPADEPDNPDEPQPQEDILGSLLALALQNESFAQQFAEQDKGFGYKVLKAEDVSDGTQFMVYFYENEEEAASQTVNEEDVRSIVWKRESL